MAFGGAGPLHAARLARELDIRRILVPRNPGILLRARPAADRPARRFRHHAAAAARAGVLAPTIESAFAALERAGRRLVRARGDRRRRPPRSRAPSTCATRARTTSCRSPLPDGPITPTTLDAARATASPTRTSACTASSPRTSRCSSSPSASRRPASSARRAQGRSLTPARTPRRAIAERRDVWLAESRRLRHLPGLRPRHAEGRQPHRRPADHRADGCDDGRAAGHDRARRSLSQPDPGDRMNVAVAATTLRRARSDHRRGDRQRRCPRSSRRWARRWSAPPTRPTSRSGATARPRCSTSRAARCARPSTSRSISAASSASCRIS